METLVRSRVRSIGSNYRMQRQRRCDCMCPIIWQSASPERGNGADAQPSLATYHSQAYGRLA